MFRKLWTITPNPLGQWGTQEAVPLTIFPEHPLFYESFEELFNLGSFNDSK